MRFWLPLLTLLVAVALPLWAAEAVTQPEPGPEDGGLRMRLLVVPRTDILEGGYEVRVDLINVSDRALALRAGWTGDDAGDLKDYLDAATSIECVPAVQHLSKIAHWRLTVTDVKPGHSIGNLELVFPRTPMPPPSRMEVTLIWTK